jgi:flagellar biosynthesis GTPase FlhF
MAESYLDKVADELADLALADQAASGDIAIVDQVGEILGASSQILQEAFLTAVRIRRAETRAREMLSSRKANGFKAAPKPKAAPLQGLSDEDKEAAEAEIAANANAEDGAAQKAHEEAAALKAAKDAAAKEEAEKATAAKAKANAEAKAKADTAAKAKAEKEAAAKAPPAPEESAGAPISGPWDLEEGAATPAAKPKPAKEPAAPAMPRRVKR